MSRRGEDSRAVALDIKATEIAIALALDTLLADLDVRVYRFPETPEDFGEAGRISQLFIGFEKIRTLDRSERNPLLGNERKVGRSYEMIFKINVELFDLTDYDDALDVLDRLLRIDGYVTPIPESRPLLLNELEFDSFQDGYWRYEGELTIVVDTSTPIFRPDDYLETVQISGVRVGIWKSPIGKGSPVPSDSTKDQDFEVVPVAP
jgi:hypothetical protein